MRATAFAFWISSWPFVCEATMQWPPKGSYHMVDPVFTPYTANGSVNFEVIPAYAQLCAESQVDVVLLGGSTAEWPSLTANERLALLSAWRSALDALPAARRPQLIFHAGDVNIPAAQHLAEQSESHGADAILIVAPCIMRPATLNDLVKSIQAVAEKAPKLPSVYYHYPELYGVDFKMDEFAAAAAKAIPTFAGVKYIDADMKTLASATGVEGGKLTFFNNDPLLAGLAVGSKGAISYTTVFPFARQMQEAFVAGDLQKAQHIQRKIFEYDSLISKYGGKAAARALPEIFASGIVMGPPRAPLTGLRPSDMPKLKHDLIAAGFLNKSAESSAPTPSIDHQQLVSPTSFGVGPSPQGAAIRGVFYFLPPPGANVFITYDSLKKTWGTLEIDASSGVLTMLKGASLAAVPATVQGLDDFLVVSGGGTKNVHALNMRTKTWKALAGMTNSQTNSCSVGCLGYWMSMTGDMKKEGLGASKPANRQEYRYNLTSGEHFEVNGEKERGGAGCACDEVANSGAGRAFWAGGYSNSGLTTQVEMWSVNPNKRGGQPIFKMSASRRDVGASVCGGRLIVAGGKDGNVDVFNSSSITDGERITYKLVKALPSPRIACLGKRVALISGGNQKQVFLVDTSALPAAGSVLASLPHPLSGAGQVAVAADALASVVMFFDGQHADLFSMKGILESTPVLV